MAEHINVEHTETYKLLSLLLLTFIVFVFSFYILLFFKLDPVFIVIPFIVTGIFFYSIKRRFITKSKIIITTKWIDVDEKRIEYENILKYRIDWTNKIDVHIKMKNKKNIRLSSNDTFCNTDKFIGMCNDLEKQLNNYKKGAIEIEQTYLNTKLWYYFVIGLSVITVIAFIYGMIKRKDIPTSFLIGLSSLGYLWSSVQYKKNK